MQTFSEQLEINAPDHVVYDVIADLPHYKDWNKWIHHAEGSTVPNGKVLVKMRMGGSEKTFDHRMISAIRPHTFHWCDVGWFTLFADGERIRHINALSDSSCHYQVEIRVTGVGQHLAKLFFGKFLTKGLVAEAQSLKARAEFLFVSSGGYV